MSVLKEWHKVVSARKLSPSPAQKSIATTLDRFMLPSNPQRGCYIHGSVGTGKTFLLDCFHRVTPLSKRVHFHEFMMDVHQSLFQTKSMAKTVKHLTSAAPVLCFDEFQVTDVADAVLLHQLFQGLFATGKVVITSNRSPSELYHNGINRQALFVPFQRLLEKTCVIVDINALGADTDYRTTNSEMCHQETIKSPINTKEMDALYLSLSKVCKARYEKIKLTKHVKQGTPSPLVDIPVSMGRSLKNVQLSENGVARTTFDSLCGSPVGSLDYLALANKCHTLVLDGIPEFGVGKHNEARRFITLIDVLYDKRACLIASSEAPLDLLFSDVSFGVVVGNDLRIDTDKMMDREISVRAEGGSSGRSSTFLSDGVEWSATGLVKVSLAEFSAVQDVSFAYRRALSRLQEMQRLSYWQERPRG